jgi:uncharacterized protein
VIRRLALLLALAPLSACGGGADDNVVEVNGAAAPVAPALSAAPTPEPVAVTTHVLDEAHVLDAAAAAALDQKLAAFEARTKHKILVITRVSLNGRKIEQVSDKIGNDMGLHDGVILLLAPTERRVTIGVGNDVRKLLTQAEANRIVKQTMYPDLHANHFAPALLRGADGILAELSETIA